VPESSPHVPPILLTIAHRATMVEESDQDRKNPAYPGIRLKCWCNHSGFHLVAPWARLLHHTFFSSLVDPSAFAASKHTRCFPSCIFHSLVHRRSISAFVCLCAVEPLIREPSLRYSRHSSQAARSFSAACICACAMLRFHDCVKQVVRKALVESKDVVISVSCNVGEFHVCRSTPRQSNLQGNNLGTPNPTCSEPLQHHKMQDVHFPTNDETYGVHQEPHVSQHEDVLFNAI
jgi:hypothetical protein